MSRRTTVWASCLGALFAGAGLFLVLDHQRLDSPTMDEPFHALASAEYVLSGTYWANLEHPPLTKLLAGICLDGAGARAPRIPMPFSFATAEQPMRWAYSNSISPESLFAAARRPFPVFFLLLVGGAALWTGRRLGPAAGAAVALFLSFEPTLVAHAALLHTDVAAALGFFATIAAFLWAAEGASLSRWVVVGLLLGLSLAAKFSAVFLVPVLALLALARTLTNRRPDASGRRPPPDLRPLGGLAAAFAVAVAVLLASYVPALRRMSGTEAETSVRFFLLSRQATPETVEAVARVSRLCAPAGHYLAGLTGIAVQNRLGGGVCVLHGKVSVDGFWDYFFVAYGVKSSLGLLLLLGAGAALAAWRRPRVGITVLALLVPVAQIFLSGTVTTYNIGVRHVLPATPFLVVLAVGAVTRQLPGVRGLALVFGLGLLQAVETVAVHPHEISFFNAAAGGPGNGAAWLNDSNLDWGQDLGRLSRELRRRGQDDGVTVAYFGGGYPPHDLPKARLFDAAATPLTPGLYAVSSYLLAAGPEAMLFHGDAARAAGYERLRSAIAQRGIPEGRVGYSILLYRLPGGGRAP